ncbi:MAG: hypothetical protein JNK04_09280, partial [Myxococcales bacterium]|nr:hypothetical protein [Myxococcales bacterium]
MRLLPQSAWSSVFRLKTGLVALGVGAFVALPLACGDDSPTDDGPPSKPVLLPGDICSAPAPNLVKARFSPSQVFVPACAASDASCVSRKVRVIIEPDVCDQTPVSFESSDPAALPAPDASSVTLYQNEIEIDVHGSPSPGRYSITAKVAKGDGTDASGTLDVVVLDDKVPTCSGTANDGDFREDEILAGDGELLGASIALPKGANQPNSGSYLWSVEPFAATLECGDLDMPDGHIPLGPAITFGPEDLSFPREVQMTVPVNPALVPAKGRFRHVRM